MAQKNDMKKVIIYQVLPRLYGNANNTNKEYGTIDENGAGKMSAFDNKVLKELHDMGVTHIWYTGIIRHASKTDYRKYGVPLSDPVNVKGNAGSPYAICDYYDVDPDIADDVKNRMGEFSELVERTHKAGLKIIIDFVPNHTAVEYNGTFKPFTDENYYPGRLHDGDWTDTAKLNYENKNTWQKMVDILLFWAALGVDGVRCDMAEMVTVDFWEFATKKIRDQYPDFIFIGEVYNPAEYRNYAGKGGFDYLYDKVGMYDTIRQVTTGMTPAYRITEQWQKVDDIKDKMLYFLENHDEQRVASEFFAKDGRNGFPALVTNVFMTKAPFMIYFGQEYGEKAMDKEGYGGVDGRTTIFDYWTPTSVHHKTMGKLTKEEKEVFDVYKKVLTLANKEKALREGDFFDLMYVNPASDHFDNGRQYAFLRKSGDETVLVCTNFSDRDANVKVRIPAHAFDFMSLPTGKHASMELLSGKKGTFVLNPDDSVSLTIPAHFAVAWKIKK